MRAPAVDRFARCTECLSQHLATIYLRTADIAALAPENIVFDLLQRQQL
jgi:hypothetical protein